MKTRALAVLVSFAVLTLLAPMGAWQREGDEPRWRVRIVVANADTIKASLESSGYDVLETNSADSTIELVVSASELRALESSGFSVVLIEQSRPFQQRPQSKAIAAPSGALVPGGTTAAVPASYRNLAGVYTRMQEIANAHPTIARFVDLTVEYQTPPTFENRHMFALKISDNVAIDEDEPAMLIVGTHHAREINVPVIGLEAANNLTSRYGTDSRIAAAVNNNEIWIAPVWNPDGYNWVFTVNNMWRKNRRILTGAVGVDQNRNYPQGWSTSCAGSTSPASDTYKGPSPASEPETQTMMAWSGAERFAKVIDYHSSGREVLFAYRCLSHPFSSWMEQEATALSEASGYGGLTREPSAEGEHYEWQFAQMGAYAFLIETGTEFQPPYESALAEAALVWPGILKVLERPISMSGHVTDLSTGAPLSAKIEILNVAFSQGETNFSGGPRGTYHMFVPPGTYDVRFSAIGYSPVVSPVTVTASSATVRDIQMSPELVVFSDDFEINRGWTTNPNGTDTATTGHWERGDPETTNSAGTKQLGTTVSGINDLVTGRLAGASASSFDIDNGSTSIQSPPIVLPSGGNLTLTFSYYLAHTSTSSIADSLRVTIVGATSAVVLQELGAANNDDAVWSVASVNLNAFAGQTIRIRVDAADSGASIVEAAIDDVRVTRANNGPVAVNDTATTAEDTTATIAVLANDSDPNGDPLSVTATTQGAHGAVTLVSGVVRYAPAPDYFGPDSFTYTASDGNGGAATGTVTVTVTPVNDNPVAVDDAATVTEDSAGTSGNVLGNDTDVDPGTTLTATLGASPSDGTVTLAADGTFTYTPAPDFNGTDSFTYTAGDGTAVSNLATVTIAVTAVNDAPMAVNDTASTTEETAVSGAVLGNDLDVETGTTLTATLDASPANGTVTLAANGTFTYTPAVNFNGTDTFTYRASDGAAVSNLATVTITVTGVNDAPVAVNDTATVSEDSAGTTGNVLGNDTDVDTGTTLTATLGASPAHGAVTLTANGSFTYTPNLNFNGTDSFTYTASDGNGGAATGTVTVTVTPVNDAPVAVNDTATVSEDSAGTSGNVLGNDTDVDTGTTLTATLGASPANGTVTLAANGTFTYTPAPDFNGTDSFTYTASDGTAVSNVATVTIAVTAVNDAPMAINDTASTTEETAVSGAVLGNDLDVETGTTLTATLDAGPANGAVTLAANGTFTYTPAANFSGTDSFTYTASDGAAVSNVATVTITVTGVNDAPVAANDATTVTEDSAGTTGNVLGNDTDVDTGTTLTATLGASPAHGAVTLTADGSFTYTPTANFSGTDSFTYTASDGTAVSNVATATITVTAVNDAPVAVNDTATVSEDSAGTSGNVLGNDTDVDTGTTLTATLGASPANGTVTLAANGAFTYTPAPDFNGTDSFTYTASDGTAVSNVATVTIAVTAVNDAPMAINDTASTTEETAVSGAVLGNDLDVETGTTLTATLDAGPANGTVTLAANGTFTYTPAVNFSGTDSFTYTASDGAAVSNVATVTITVTGVNDAPVAVNDTVSTPEETAVSGAVLGNDTDVDTGTTLTATLGASPANGTVTLAANGTFTYTPAVNFSGTDSFTYTASDGTAVSNVATATITVTAVNDAPVAVNDTATVSEDSAGTSGNVLGNDTDVDTGTTLTATLGASPANGTVTLAANGAFTYTPAPDFNGTDSFTYTASDGTAVSNVATVTIAVTAVNDAPMAINDTASTTEETAVSGAVLGNDLDVETGTTLTATLDAGPANGTVTLAANGTFTYTPAVNFSGTDSFTYTASDGAAVSNVATVTITVTGVNDAPVAVNDTVSTPEETAVSGAVLGNDTDVDTGTTLTATLGASPANGTVTLAANGTFTYTPAVNFSGTDSFTYTASDGAAVSNVATVTITVTAVNDAPVAVNDTATVSEDSAGTTGNVLGNDTDVDTGTTLTATLAASPANGTVTLAANGTFTYTPAPDFNGTDSFTYTASDGTAVSNLATVTIAVTAVNDAPMAVNDTASTTEDAAVSGAVLGNDLDVEAGTTLTATLDAGPANGTVTLAANGTFTYTPAVNFSGTDSFTYTASDGAAVSNVATVTITVTGVNDAPVAVNDTATVSEDSAGTTGNVLGNDTDVDTGTTLTATLAASPANGTVTLAANGTFTYTPAPDFNGTDSFTYTASDGTAVSNLATVTIAVTAVNDAPMAVNDTASTTEDAAVSGAVLGNDLDVEAGTTLTATLDAGPANGTVTLAANGTFTYTPAVNFSGTDSFTYTASDGAAVSNVATVTITVTGVNDAPVAVNDTATVSEDSAGTTGNVLGNDTDVDTGTTLTATLAASPAHGAVTLNTDGSFTYTPAVNFSGTDSFTYTASDGTAVSNLATVTITVSAVNDAPVAADDTAATAQGTAVSGTVLGNDTDVDTGTTLTATLAASPANGTVTLAANGTFTYTPAANFSGTDSFTYTASDGTAVSNVATVTITVTRVNNAPVAVDDTATVSEDSAGTTGNVLGNDTDSDAGATLTATLAASPANGTVTLAANGTFTYTPAPDFNGTDSFTYTASDGTAVSNVATVTITVTAVNDAPMAINDTASTTEETAVSGAVLGNDLDVETGTTLTATLDAGPANGTVTLAANGTFTYTPAVNFSGTDSFTYTASDGAAVSNVATVTITVTGVNDAPVAADDTAATAQGTAVSGTVLGNDTDVDTGTTLTATLAASPANGTVTLAANGTFTYTPAANFSGTDSFTYTASDGTAVSNVATVTITVTRVNNAPVAVDDTAAVSEDSAGTTGNVLGNDTDSDAGTTLTATLAASPANGTVTLAANGTFTYTPAPDFNGTDSFTYTASDGTAVSNLATVTIAVTAVNDAPMAVNDTASTTEDAAVSGAVLGNDLDVDAGTTLTATLAASPANGTVTLAANGTFTYTPAVNFNGTDTFTYRASDGAAVSNLATVTITITAVNDAPVAADDTASTAQGTAVSGTVLGNDTDVDPGAALTASLGAGPANGTVTLALNGSFTYTPTASFSGTDSFTYTASDGAAASNVATVTITVTPVSDPVVFADDFETARGWTTNPNGTDTATTGQWERGNPESTTSTGTKQLGTTVSGVNGLVTGRLEGTSVGSFDIDNGSTSIQSPAIVLPSGGNLTLTFSYYLAHLSNSSTADYLRVTIVGTTTAVVFQELGAANNDDAAWAEASVSLTAFAGQTIRIRIDAADAGSASLVEAAIDDVKIVR